MPPSYTRKPIILVTDDDAGMRFTVSKVMEDEGYDVVNAVDGAESVALFEQIQPDIVLMDVVMPVMDGFAACAEIQRLPGGSQVPVLMMTAYENQRSVDEAFQAGASDYLTKPINWSVLRYRVRRLLKARETDEHLQQTIEQLDILHRIDRELGYTLNLDRVLGLAMDTALRRSGASACVVGWIREESQLVEGLASIGKPTLLAQPLTLDALCEKYPLTVQMFRDSEPVLDVQADGRYASLLIPMMNRGKPAGLIGLEKVPVGLFTDAEDWQFLVHLAGRTAAALDKARVYQKAETHARQMERLYEVSTAISSRLDRQDVMEMSTRGLVVLLEASSAFFCEYDRRSNTMKVRTIFVVEGMPDQPPAIGAIYSAQTYPEIIKLLHEGPVQLHLNDPTLSPAMLEVLQPFGGQHVLLVPLTYEDELLGMLVLCESRFDRYYSSEEINLARNLALQVTVALQQATLFANVQQLEQLKSEMIRMASHDLRNPLHSVNGYLELLLMELGSRLDAQQQEFVSRMKNGLKKMQSLLEDILNLEKIESQQTAIRQPVNMWTVISEVCESNRPQAELKRQRYSVKLPPPSVLVSGSELQLTQAMTNLISNAIKYTPEGGSIQIRAWVEGRRFMFEVEDNGYGVPKERQPQLFERFYRAYAPGTEDIPGTGLGLSLVKTVVERHSGEVWFQSEPGIGSTFGCWLPLMDVD